MLVFQSCKHAVSSHRALSLVLFGRDGVDWVSLFLKGWHGVRRLSPRQWAVMQGRLAVLTIRSEQCAQGCPEEGLITMEQSKKANFRTSLPLTSKCHHRWLGLQHVDLGETNIYSPRRAIMHSAAMKIFVCVFWGLYILIKSFKHFLKKIIEKSLIESSFTHHPRFSNFQLKTNLAPVLLLPTPPTHTLHFEANPRLSIIHL